MGIMGYKEEATTARTTTSRKRIRECEHTSVTLFYHFTYPYVFLPFLYFFLSASLTIPLTLLAV